MKSLILQTDAPCPHELVMREQHKLVAGPRGLEVRARLVLNVPRKTLGDMLVEVDDGTNEVDVREAIQAAALADDWALANEIAVRYGLVVCLRCASDVAGRPTWRLHRLMRQLDAKPVNAADWGEICGSCAAVMLNT